MVSSLNCYVLLDITCQDPFLEVSLTERKTLGDAGVSEGVWVFNC